MKWITRIELTDETAEGFYEKQGLGPNFMVPIRTRVDQPAHDWIAMQELRGPVLVKGVAFGGNRGISRVEFTADDGATWADARLDYPGTRLTWALWSFDWQPSTPGDHVLWARATNQDGEFRRGIRIGHSSQARAASTRSSSTSVEAGG